ncbi:hypothetical protein HJG60_008807 [Phyllostomus discolor]|uniref:Uncharacterized protein n=1 Tax=Phyllostomus discolor TaxID=89673 RepID=A0A833YWB7_9CHIR|nr:hypothetical protein HJG60_008807 [Phyllostomus discolor]
MKTGRMGEGGGEGSEGERAGESGREREGKGETREGERERDLNFPSGRGAVARQGLAEGRDWRAPPAAAAAPARRAELHEAAAAGAGRAEGTAWLSPASPAVAQTAAGTARWAHLPGQACQEHCMRSRLWARAR